MATDGWPGACDVPLPLGELMSVVASPMFVDVMPLAVLLPLVALPPAVVPPPVALAPPDVETPIDDVVGKVDVASPEIDELVAPPLATTKPLPRLMDIRVFEVERLAALPDVLLEP
jgi:hypothetical protein